MSASTRALWEPMILRRSCLIALIAPLSALAADDLPARNLLIEWRVGETVVEQRQSGMLVLRSDGSGTRGRAGIETRSGGQSAEAVQRLLVLNGSTASLQIAESVPWQFVEAAWQGGGSTVAPRRGVVMGTQWVASGHGLQVQPRWPGGSAPVRVELRAEAAAPLADGGGAREELRTTLGVPLDQWTVVAERMGTGTRQTLSLRISAP